MMYNWAMRRNRRSSWVAWILFAIVCALTLVDIILNTRNLTGNIITMSADASWLLLPIVFSAVGALIISRQPRNRIGWLLMGPAIFFAAVTPVSNYLRGFTVAPAPTLPILLMTWVTGWSWLLLIFPLLLILLLFPTGRPPSPRWRWLLAYAGALFAIFLSMATFDQQITQVDAGWSLVNPIGLIPYSLINNILIPPWLAGLLLLAILCAISLFVRYRRAQAIEREQIKWLLYAGAVFVVYYVMLNWLSKSHGLLQDVSNLLFFFFIALIPVAIGVAILRYRLWDIDVIIRKTLTYSVLTALLALVFFGGVVLLQQTLGRVAGFQNTPVAIVLSTLAIAALFGPLRRAIQEAIDRRFFRKSYDAQKILDGFSAALREEVEMEKLVAHLLSAVDETLQPESVSVWLKGQGIRE